GTSRFYTTMSESRQTRAPVGLTTPLQYLKGVGPHRAKLLERKGLISVDDALFHLPMRHEDRTHFTPLRAIRPGETVTCSGVVTGMSPPPPGRLLPLAEAVRGAHFPASESARAAAVRRLAFDDFLLLQLGLAILRSRTTRQRGVSMRPRGELIARLRASLPFSLTAAQERVWDDIRGDMAAPYPMHRLLQGDVGSGKTVVAALAVCAAVEAGYQAAVMAPT